MASETTIPLWNDQMKEVKYTEIACHADLAVYQTPLPEDSGHKDIGRWGEALVYNYLTKQRHENPSMLDVIWANEIAETGLPYDIEVVFKTEDAQEGEAQQYSVFIDVKATVTEDKHVFEISPRQIEYAMQKEERYQIFRVFNAGKHNLRLVRIDNVADRLLTHNVKLYMMI